MTALIYLFLMSLTLFVLPQIIVKILTGHPKFDKNILLLILAAFLPIAWSFLPRELHGDRFINFLQHATGGGVAVGLVSIYFINSLKEKYPTLTHFFFQVLFFYALVSMFGVLNELLEFFLDYFEIGVFSSDRYDTWFDLLANTTGSVTIFVLYRIRQLIYSWF